MNGRQDWCCKHEHVGCASHESYDCSPRLSHWDCSGSVPWRPVWMNFTRWPWVFSKPFWDDGPMEMSLIEEFTTAHWDEARPLQSPWGRWCLSCFGLVLSQFSIFCCIVKAFHLKTVFFHSPRESSSKQLDHQTWANSTIKAAHNIVILSHDRWILLAYVGMTDIWQLVFPCMSPGKMIPLDWYL